MSRLNVQYNGLMIPPRPQGTELSRGNCYDPGPPEDMRRVYHCLSRRWKNADTGSAPPPGAASIKAAGHLLPHFRSQLPMIAGNHHTVGPYTLPNELYSPPSLSFTTCPLPPYISGYNSPKFVLHNRF